MVDNEGTKSISLISIYFKTWIRLGVSFAAPIGDPATAIPNKDKLEQIKNSPYTLQKAVIGLNTTCNDRGVPNINEQDLLNALTLAGNSLFKIIELAKS
jgi:hypothetical protein